MTDIPPIRKSLNDRFKARSWPVLRREKSADKDVNKEDSLKRKPFSFRWPSFTQTFWGMIKDIFGEVVAVVIGLAILWFCALNSLLAAQNVDVLGLKPNAQLLFSQLFNGADAEIGEMHLSWNPATNTVEFRTYDVVINDKNGLTIETISALETEIPLREAISGRFKPSELVINGGTVTWFRDSQGDVVAGLGTPDTVGRLGPVWRGVNPDSTRAAPNVDGVDHVTITNATAYIVDDRDGVDIVLRETDIEFQQSQEQVNVTVKSSLETGGTAAPFTLDIEASPDYKDYSVTLEAGNVNPAILAPRRGRYSRYRIIDANVDAKASFKVTREAGLQRADIDLSSGAGQLSLEDRPLDFQALNIKAFLTPGSQVMDIINLGLVSDKFKFSGSGNLSELGALTDGNINSSPVFDMEFTDVFVDAVPAFAAPLNVSNLIAQGRLDVDSRTLSLKQFRADFGDYELRAEGQVRQGEQGDWKLVQLAGQSIGTFSNKDLLSLWPVKAAEGARRWIDRSVTQALLSNLKFDLDMNSEVIGGRFPTPEEMQVSFDIGEADINYIQTMTPYLGVSGSGLISGNSGTFTGAGGRVGTIEVDEAIASIPEIFRVGSDIEITIKARGEAQELISLIDQKPFEFASKYGVNPNDFTGQGEITLDITRPLRVNFDRDRILFSANGEFKKASAPFSIGGHKLKDADVSFAADRKGMSIKGPASIGAWRTQLEWEETFDYGATPTRYGVSGTLDRDTLDSLGIGFRGNYDGTISLDIEALGQGLELSSGNITADLSDATLNFEPHWSKAAGVPGRFTANLVRSETGGMDFPNLSIKAPGLDMQGSLSLAENFRLLNLDFTKAYVDGFIDSSLQVKPDEAGEKLSIFVSGRFLDVSEFISNAMSSGGSAASIPVFLTAGIERLALAEAYIVSDANVLFSHDGTGITNARLSGKTPDGELTAEIVTGLLDAPQSPNRRINIEIPDSSKALFAFFGMENMEGGHMNVDAELPPLGVPGAINGTLNMREFKLIEAPILAQMLSIGSLTGLLDTLSGSGLAFDELNIPFSLRGKRLSFRDARVSGPALGMTGAGDVSFDDQVLELDGVLVPAYSANSLLDDIPIISDIFIGKKGEGVFALSYTVAGPFQKTQITLNPLSALTPGFLRGIFRVKRDKLPATVIADIEAVRPQ